MSGIREYCANHFLAGALHPYHPSVATQHDLGGGRPIDGAGDHFIFAVAEFALGYSNFAGCYAQPLAVGYQHVLIEAELFFEFFELFLAQAALSLAGGGAFAALVGAARGFLQHPVERPAGHETGDGEYQ